MAKTNKLKFSKKEWFWYILSLTVVFVGLVFAIIGIIGSHLPVKASDNWVTISEKAWLSNWSNMGYRLWGIILILAGTAVFCFCLTMFAREGDRDSERALRRAQRLAAANAVKQEQPAVVEAEEVAPKA